jgi:hypothetical protein
VLVADGVYSGPENRALDFSGRDFTVRSANGAAACVIDCESVGRAFRLRSGESLAARIKGLTVFRGEGKPTISPGAVGGAIVVENSSVTVADCVFVQCNAINRGGAIYLHQSSAESSGTIPPLAANRSGSTTVPSRSRRLRTATCKAGRAMSIGAAA